MLNMIVLLQVVSCVSPEHYLHFSRMDTCKGFISYRQIYRKYSEGMVGRHLRGWEQHALCICRVQCQVGVLGPVCDIHESLVHVHSPSCRSETYKLNITGPRMDPCGMLNWDDWHEGLLSSICTNCD